MLPPIPGSPRSAPPPGFDGTTPRLRVSSPRYVATMRDGAFFLLVAMVIQVLTGVGGAAAGAAVAFSMPGDEAGAESVLGLVSMVQMLFVVVGSVAGLLGWWWLSSADPQEPTFAEPSRSRPVVRGLAVGQAGVVIALSVMPFVLMALAARPGGAQNVGGPLGVIMTMSVLLGAATVVKFFASMSYVRWLAQRLPDETLEMKAARFMWLGPLLMTVGAFLIVGPLIAVLMYWGLIFRVWGSLREVSREQLDDTMRAVDPRRRAA